MPHCAAYKCTSRHGNKIYDDQNRKITFHRFPHGDEERLKEWLVQLRRKDFYPSKKAVLCSKHFEDKFMYRFAATVRLREGAVPTIFDFPPHIRTKEKPVSPSYTINTRSGKRFSEEDCSGKDSTSTEKTPTVKMKQKSKASHDETLRKNEMQKETGSGEADTSSGLLNKADNQKVSQLNSVATTSVVKKRRGRKILLEDPPPSPTSNVTAEPMDVTNIRHTTTSKEEAVVKAKQPRRRKILREESPPPPPNVTLVQEIPPAPMPPSKGEAVVKVKQPRRRKILREESPSPPPNFIPVYETLPPPVRPLDDTTRAPVHYDGKDVLEYINVSRAARKRKAQIFVDHSYAIMESAKELKQKLLDVTAALILAKKKLKGAYQYNTRLKRRLSTLVLFIDSLKNAEKHSNTFELLDDLETLMLDEPWVKS